jgi:hypothetical protein
MPMYELVLWFQGNEDIRITDQRVSIGETLVIDNRRWLVEAQDLPRDPSATARFICSRRATGSSGTARRPVRAARTT